MVLVGVGGSEIIGVFQQRLTSGLGEAGHDAGFVRKEAPPGKAGRVRGGQAFDGG